MTRRITKEEGIFAGNSAGSAMAGLLQMANQFNENDVVVVIFHDHGTRYLGKMFNDDWMRTKGYLDPTGQTAKDIVAAVKHNKVMSVEVNETIESTARLMQERDFSQLTITKDGRIVGSINEQNIFECLTKHPNNKGNTVESIMSPAFPFVDITTPLEALSNMITPENPAVLVRDFKTDEIYIITRHDIISMMC
jgi:cystathionine beta-synthase